MQRGCRRGRWVGVSEKGWSGLERKWEEWRKCVSMNWVHLSQPFAIKRNEMKATEK